MGNGHADITRRECSVRRDRKRDRSRYCRKKVSEYYRVAEQPARPLRPRLAAEDSNEATRPRLPEVPDHSHQVLHSSRGRLGRFQVDRKLVGSLFGLGSRMQSLPASPADAVPRILVYLFVSQPAIMTPPAAV